MFDNRINPAGPALRSLFGVLFLLCISSVSANECLNLLPYDVAEDGLPKLCLSGVNGKRELYSCQDYRSGNSHYRVLYKGGRVPKAVLALRADGKEVVLTSLADSNRKLSCPLKAPAGVPKYASHRGLGVCADEHDQAIACSMYVYAAARESVAHSYMVFYPRDSREKLQVEISDAGKNENAMVAEIAYQIGLQLSQTECCNSQALRYLSYAYHLFPRSETYRQAYQRSRATLALSQL